MLHDGSAVTLPGSAAVTAQGLGDDESAYTELMAPFVAGADDLLRDILGPLSVPSSPLLLARFGLAGLRSFDGLVNERFVVGERAKPRRHSKYHVTFGPQTRPGPSASDGATSGYLDAILEIR